MIYIIGLCLLIIILYSLPKDFYSSMTPIFILYIPVFIILFAILFGLTAAMILTICIVLLFILGANL